MILHGNEPAAGGTDVFAERSGIERLDAVKIEHANADSARFEFIASLERFVNRHARADYRNAIVGALPQHLQAGHAKLLVVAVQDRGLWPRRSQITNPGDRKSTRLNSSHSSISYAV